MSSVISRELLFYSAVFAKVRFMWKTWPKNLTTHTTAKFQDIKLWMHISQLKKSPPDIWFCINPGNLKIKLTGKRSNWHGGRLLPSKTLGQKCFFPFSFPFQTIFLLMLHHKDVLNIFHHFFLSWVEKKIQLFTYLRPLQRKVIHPPTDC